MQLSLEGTVAMEGGNKEREVSTNTIIVQTMYHDVLVAEDLRHKTCLSNALVKPDQTIWSSVCVCVWCGCGVGGVWVWCGWCVGVGVWV